MAMNLASDEKSPQIVIQQLQQRISSLLLEINELRQALISVTQSEKRAQTEVYNASKNYMLLEKRLMRVGELSKRGWMLENAFKKEVVLRFVSLTRRRAMLKLNLQYLCGLLQRHMLNPDCAPTIDGAQREYEHRDIEIWLQRACQLLNAKAATWSELSALKMITDAVCLVNELHERATMESVRQKKQLNAMFSRNITLFDSFSERENLLHEKELKIKELISKNNDLKEKLRLERLTNENILRRSERKTRSSSKLFVVGGAGASSESESPRNSGQSPILGSSSSILLESSATSRKQSASPTSSKLDLKSFGRLYIANQHSTSTSCFSARSTQQSPKLFEAAHHSLDAPTLVNHKMQINGITVVSSAINSDTSAHLNQPSDDSKQTLRLDRPFSTSNVTSGSKDFRKLNLQQLKLRPQSARISSMLTDSVIRAATTRHSTQTPHSSTKHTTLQLSTYCDKSPYAQNLLHVAPPTKLHRSRLRSSCK